MGKINKKAPKSQIKNSKSIQLKWNVGPEEIAIE